AAKFRAADLADCIKNFWIGAQFLFHALSNTQRTIERDAWVHGDADVQRSLIQFRHEGGAEEWNKRTRCKKGNERAADDGAAPAKRKAQHRPVNPLDAAHEEIVVLGKPAAQDE